MSDRIVYAAHGWSYRFRAYVEETTLGWWRWKRLRWTYVIERGWAGQWSWHTGHGHFFVTEAEALAAADAELTRLSTPKGRYVEGGAS